mgnify:CR=1 FL=1
MDYSGVIENVLNEILPVGTVCRYPKYIPSFTMQRKYEDEKTIRDYPINISFNEIPQTYLPPYERYILAILTLETKK